MSVPASRHAERTLINQAAFFPAAIAFQAPGPVVAENREDGIFGPHDQIADQAGWPTGAPISLAVAQPTHVPQLVHEGGLLVPLSLQERHGGTGIGEARVRQTDA